MNDADRLKYLKQNPHCTNQGQHGSCGFTGTLMGLLVHAPKEVDALFDTVTKGAIYRGVQKSASVKARLEKRLDKGLIEKNEDHALDMRLSIGLMITLKEHLKQENNDAVWNESQGYSALFQDDVSKAFWKHGNKLKDYKNGVNLLPPEEEFAFSYKHGDMALTVAAQKSLLNLVGFKSVSSTSLVSNEDVAKQKNQLNALVVNPTLKGRLMRLASDLKAGTYAGAMVGVAHKDFIGVKAHEKYEYIAHWVYMPKPYAAAPVNVFDNNVWTWGFETNLKRLLVQGDYVPKVAVTFEN